MTASVPRPDGLGQSVLVYDRIGHNKRQTWLMMGLFILLIGALATAISYFFGGTWQIMPFVFAGLIAWSLFSYYASSRVALSISGAREATREEEPELYRIVENLCIGSGLPMPKVYVIDDTAPNAFATGRDPKHASVAATRGLMQKLDKAELEAVMAHEMSHVGNYDIRIATVSVVMLGLVALLADFFMRWAWFGAGSRRSNSDKGGGAAAIMIMMAAVALAVLAPIAAQLIHLAISRQREFLADASGALLCRNPDALARALEKISADPDPLEVANKATAHMYFENPLKEHKSFLNSLFTTHPPAAERIRLLRAM